MLMTKGTRDYYFDLFRKRKKGSIKLKIKKNSKGFSNDLMLPPGFEPGSPG